MIRKRSLPAIIRLYRTSDQARLTALLGFYSSLPSLEEAIEKAAFAEDQNGKRHPHQRRIKRVALSSARDALMELKDVLAQTTDFTGLHAIVEQATRSILGLGELYRYDTALRIGAKRDIEPELVYLHAGTKRGARKLGTDPRATPVRLEELPRDLAALRPKEVEDLLCIYKDDL